MNITARQLINSDLGKMIEFAIYDAENMSDLHVTGKLETYQHFTYRESREPVTKITFAGILHDFLDFREIGSSLCPR